MTKKFTDLTADTTPVGADILATAKSPFGGGSSHKVTLQNLAKAFTAFLFGQDAGGTDAYAITLAPVPAALITGEHYRFKANTANTGPATLNINGLGAVTIKKAAGGITTDLADNDIRAGQWVDVVYDGTNFQMQSTLGNASAGGSPGGLDTYVQFNDGGAFGGVSIFTYAKTTARLTLGNAASGDAIIDLGNSGTFQLGATPLAALGTHTPGYDGLLFNRDFGIAWTDSTTATGGQTLSLVRDGNKFLKLQRGAVVAGFGTINWILIEGELRCTADFGKTTDTALATITGCSVALITDAVGGFANNGFSSVYSIEFEANVNADATGGYKFAVAYSGTVTNIAYTVQFTKEGTPGTLDLVSRQTASGGAAGAAGATAGRVRISGAIEVGGNGTLTIQFAQNVSNGTSTVLKNGSFLHVKPIVR